MRVGITGANGFIGWHLRCFYKTLPYVEVLLADRSTFSNEKSLGKFVSDSDAIVHLAGVNRADDDEILKGNVDPAKKLIDACISESATPHILFASSTHSENATSAYGAAKARVSALFSEWAEKTQGHYLELIIPHVFGEYGRPNYNSAVNTFCHQFAAGKPASVRDNGTLELIHVQMLCEMIHCELVSKSTGLLRLSGIETSVYEVVSQLEKLSKTYSEKILPSLDDGFERDLFNTYRGAFDTDQRETGVVQHTDERGWLFETVKAQSGGQCFVSSSRPGITRGNHFHRRKVERFFVLAGTATIRIRRLFDEKIVEYNVDGNSPCYIDIPTLHTHSIENTGSDELITLFWSNEIFDPQSPDTFEEPV